MAKAQNYVHWERGQQTEKSLLGVGHRTYFLDGGNIICVRKNIYWEGGHHTYFVDGGTIGVRAPHKIERTSWNLPDFQLSWESMMDPKCGNMIAPRWVGG